jgi:uncharacterized protein YegL
MSKKDTGLTGLCTAVIRRAIQDAAKEKGDYKPALIFLTGRNPADFFFDYIGVERQYIIQQMRKRGINGF